MKKQLIMPVLAATVLVGLALPQPAGAVWPFHNKPQAQSQQDKDASANQQPDAASQKPAAQPAAQDATTPAAPAAAAEDNSSATPTPHVQVQSPLTNEVNGLKVEDPIESPALPPDKSFVAVDDPKNPLGITTAAQKLNVAAQLITQKKYKEASSQLVPLKDWLVDATEAHISLYKTLKALPNAQVQAELEKQLALQFALLRDKSFFQLGMLSIGQDDYSGAVKNLSRVIQSQPRSAMGAQAYEVLQRIGFTERLQLRDDRNTKSVSQSPQ